ICCDLFIVFFFQAEDGIRDFHVTGVQTCALPISYDVWVRQGLLRTTPGKVIDYGFVARDIGEITGGLDVVKIGFDRWRMDRMKGAMEAAGVDLPLEPFGQGYVSMSPALDALEADLLQSKVRHGGHPVLAMCAANAVAVP